MENNVQAKKLKLYLQGVTIDTSSANYLQQIRCLEPLIVDYMFYSYECLETYFGIPKINKFKHWHVSMQDSIDVYIVESTINEANKYPDRDIRWNIYSNIHGAKRIIKQLLEEV